MHRFHPMTLIVLGSVLLTGLAVGAPNVGKANDIFDYLTTTYPIRDWIANAKSEYSRFEHDQPLRHPRFTIEVDNNWREPIPFRIDFDEQCGTVRPRLCPPYLITLVPDPCREILAVAAGKPALPDRISLQRLWSVGSEINTEGTP